ncbi:hypothetical protein SK128_020498 [Halocaridina rubra]|uniref:Uncharacterized protein n=1 Tax=Halocaridina rubra TaxID=373956 RepID=A0AAN8ZXD6_HALRR
MGHGLGVGSSVLAPVMHLPSFIPSSMVEKVQRYVQPAHSDDQEVLLFVLCLVELHQLTIKGFINCSYDMVLSKLYYNAFAFLNHRMESSSSWAWAWTVGM